jgi:DNA-directed RNA polymerase subunit M/transcription elongation factor TFIIS
MSSARKAQRRAIARQSPDSDVTAAIPDERSADGDVMTFFDDDGSLIPAEQADEVASNETTVDVEEDAEAFLAEVAPERLASVEKKAGNLPGTREELIEFQARKVIKQAEERGEALHVESGGVEFTVHQEPSKDKWAAVDNTMNEDGKTLDECPKCGAEDVSASQVEIQTKGADESGTQVTKTGCGCTIRRTD